jgi:hypothetical protein
MPIPFYSASMGPSTTVSCLLAFLYFSKFVIEGLELSNVQGVLFHRKWLSVYFETHIPPGGSFELLCLVGGCSSFFKKVPHFFTNFFGYGLYRLELFKIGIFEPTPPTDFIQQKLFSLLAKALYVV